MKKLLMGMVWFVVLFVGIWIVLGCIIAARIPASDYASGEAYEQACREAGERLGIEYGVYTIAFAALLAAIGSIAGVLPGTGGRAVTDEPTSYSPDIADESAVQSQPVNFPPWSVHLLVPGVVLVSGSLGFFRSSNKGTMGLLILAMAVVVGLICSGGLLLYERLFGAIED